MPPISIQPQWTISADGRALPPRLLALLLQVHERGSLAAACTPLGLSYRHAWDMVRQGNALFGAPLLTMARGKGSRLSPLGERLVWAERRIHARLAPMLDTLASELETELRSVSNSAASPLRIHASHGFAIEQLIDALQRAGVALERKYVGTQEALAALHDGQCELAGFHVPLGRYEREVLDAYAGWLDAREHRVILLAKRRQGLMVAPGNPRKIYGLADLLRPDVRFINRQRGAGTRLLLECMLRDEGLDASRIQGFEHGEFTHAAVAAFVASGMADVGVGVETPARQFGLDFLPLAAERYFLLCRSDALDAPALRKLLQRLADPELRARLDALPGYSTADDSTPQTLRQAFGALPRRRR